MLNRSDDYLAMASNQTLPAVLTDRVQRTPDARAHWSLGDDREWSPTTWTSYFDATRRAAAALCELGLQPGERLGIMAPSCAEWDVAQMAGLAVAATVVGLDVHEQNVRLGTLLEATDIRALVVQDDSTLVRLPAEARARLSAPSAWAVAPTGWLRKRG